MHRKHREKQIVPSRVQIYIFFIRGHKRKDGIRIFLQANIVRSQFSWVTNYIQMDKTSWTYSIVR